MKTVYDVVIRSFRKVLIPRSNELPFSAGGWKDLVVDGVKLKHGKDSLEEFVVGPAGLEGFSISPASGFKNKDGIR